MKSNKLILMVLVLIMALLAACSPAAPASVEAPAAEPVPTTAPAELQAEEPAAASTEVPAAAPVEPPADQSASTASFPLGKFVSVNDKSFAFKYNPDGTFEFYAVGKDPVFVGTYTVSGDRITTERPGETDPDCAGPATNTWAFDGEKLTFSPTFEDPCKPRRETAADTYTLDASFFPEISIDAADFSYSAPDSISEGWVRVKLTNSGQEPHHVQFLRLNDGVTLEQFQEALKQGEGPALALVRQMGGVGALAPTLSAQAVLNLPAGEYVLLCLIPSPVDQVPHLAKGMIKSLTVQPGNNTLTAEPAADLTVNMQDFVFDLPAVLPDKPLSIQVINDGPEAHEFNLMRLADGKTAEDVLQYLQAPDGPPPFIPVGGMNGLDKGLSGFAEVDLQPGNYVAICNIPSPKAEGHPHFTLGMIKQFTVATQGSDTFPTGKFTSLNDDQMAYQFNPDGTFGFFYHGTNPVAEGTYTVVGSLLSVVDPSETNPACIGSITYQWSFDGTNLTFAPFSDDACQLRKDSFAETYVRSE
jgi:hypothetical protein